MRHSLSLLSGLALICAAGSASAVDLRHSTLANHTAYIPPQCYTRTEDAAGTAHNPCQTCHTRSRVPHYINDQDLQLSYALPGPALKNPWTNLFVDRSGAVAAADPEEVRAWVRQDNYLGADGQPVLAEKLASPPKAWDSDGDGRWSGYVPDAFYDFDEMGFDHAPDGQLTGWRAFAYQPLPGTFWPASGSTDDVMIRLPEAYRQDAGGRDDRAIYALNLAIVEALIQRADVPVAPVDEAALGVDLDRDGALGTATRVAFAFAPLEGITMHWVGRAGTLPADEAPLAAGLYPLGTEFLHSVRYLDPNPAGVGMAPRMKELRYMRKTRWLTYFDRMDGALAEAKERHDFPDRISLFFGDAEHGISNGTGWRLQGFIEDREGALRPQSFEETVFCMGCHGGIGVNDDDTLAFPRKLGAEAFQGGWYHWTQKGLAGTPDLTRADGEGDYVHYLRTNGAGDEFRSNDELIRAWLKDGELPEAAAARIRDDIAPLILPSPERALALDVAYREIVRDQSFALGRDATVTPQDATVWREVDQDRPTGIAEPEAPWYPRHRR
ncbi:hypothetical protein BYZ73_01780 [Rhodovulum viride]|uniref:Cytochrome c domain-containing protein n=1 Tax=Rhodovulum viride TaxID=1231134 RepID=A0ABX9DMZ4_9RHOB|nr:hypothetical protein [Rhodovulum viride]RAP42935.1 hypothetical protein BYZ73_01780 [Rhodovulum viride]